MAKKPYVRSEESQGKLDAAMERILDAFGSGQMAKPLAQIYLKGGRWAERWGVWNQIMVALGGAEDAATILQWQEIGRAVTDKSQPIWLMNPLYGYFTADVEDEGGERQEKRRYIKGFSHFAVHPVEVTVPIPGWVGESYDVRYAVQDRTEFVRSLPLAEVAEEWGLAVGTYGGQEGGANGFMVPGVRISLGVKNLSTWAHELVHEADSRAGHLVRTAGQERTNEIVAELGGAVLLTALGMETEADWGGAYQYIKSYAKKKDPEGLVKEVRDLIWRISEAVKLILETAAQCVTEPELVAV